MNRRRASPHRVLDDRQLAVEVVFLDQPVVAPLGRVPLLARGLTVAFEPLVKDRQESLDLLRRLGLALAVSRRLGVLQDLDQRVPVDLKLTASRPLAVAIDQHIPSYLVPKLHLDIHLDYVLGWGHEAEKTCCITLKIQEPDKALRF